jgi:hypothetical protein
MAVLAKKQAALQLAIRQGRENPVDRAIRILEGALGDVVVIIEAQTKEESWPAARRQERLQQIRKPVEAWSGWPGPPSGTLRSPLGPTGCGF